MNPMNMAGMNAANGGMGGMPMMMNGPNGAMPRPDGEPDDNNNIDFKARLNTYIYSYFLDCGHWDLARTLKNSGLSFEPLITNNDADVNGAEDGDSKDGIGSKRPADLPIVKDPGDRFLLGWFAVFWDIYFARGKNPMASKNANLYVAQTSQATKLRNQQQQAMLRNMPGMMPGHMGNNYEQMMRFNGGMPMNGDLRQKALQNNRNEFPGNPAQLAQMQRTMQLQHAQQQMRRDPSEMNGNGQRPHTPSGADHAPSPSKRQRLDGSVQFNGQPGMPNGRPPHGLPGQPEIVANQLLMNNGINPANLSESQFQSFQQQNPSVQHKSIQLYAQNLAKSQHESMSKVSVMSDSGSPMMPGMDLNPGSEYYNQSPAAMAQMRQGVPTGPGGAPTGPGNHALQDYQMQLMLLEQQNKKRLLMARQEQDNGQPIMTGGAGFPPGMSPQGSRGGPSPGPGDQARRGTPKMNQPGMPGSPLPDGSMRGSPAAMNFNSMNPDMYPQMNGAPGMRPPSSNPAFNGQFNPQQMDALQRSGGQRMPNGAWQQVPQGPQGPAQMLQQQQNPQQPPPPQMGTPQQRNDMPPPQAPPQGAAANGRTGSPTPPTPQPANKANPKKKGEAKDRKKPAKKGSTSVAATPAAEAEGNTAATPTPATPSTPSNPASFAQKNDVQSQPTAIQAANAAAAPQLAAAPPDPNAVQYANMDGLDPQFEANMTFNNDLNDPNLLEHFDFEQFLDINFDAGAFEGDSIEA